MGDQLLQLVIALAGAGGLFGLLTVREQRRKLRAETGKAGADATAILTGEALRMVQAAREDAEDARREAREAYGEARDCREALDELLGHVRALERLVRVAGLDVPRRPPLPGRPAAPGDRWS